MIALATGHVRLERVGHVTYHSHLTQTYVTSCDTCTGCPVGGELLESEGHVTLGGAFIRLFCPRFGT